MLGCGPGIICESRSDLIIELKFKRGWKKLWSLAQNWWLLICYCVPFLFKVHSFPLVLNCPSFWMESNPAWCLCFFALTLWCITIGTSRGWENVQRQTGCSACKGYCQAHKNVRWKPLIKHSSSESLDLKKCVIGPSDPSDLIWISPRTVQLALLKP